MLNFAATDNLFMAQAKELLHEHPEQQDIDLIAEILSLLLRMAATPANDNEKRTLQ